MNADRGLSSSSIINKRTCSIRLLPLLVPTTQSPAEQDEDSASFVAFHTLLNTPFLPHAVPIVFTGISHHCIPSHPSLA